MIEKYPQLRFKVLYDFKSTLITKIQLPTNPVKMISFFYLIISLSLSLCLYLSMQPYLA
jgi:hypothetical protein